MRLQSRRMVGSSHPPFPSAPGEPSVRRLGTGLPPNGDKPIRAQLIVALVALIVILAVPLYLWRRPSKKAEGAESTVPSAAASLALPSAIPVPSAQPSAFNVEPVQAGPLQRVRCGSNRAHATRSVPCDALPPIERAFLDAIRKTADCAPRTAREGTINYVLEIDFARKSLHVFPGKSGDWHGPSARRATKCVERALGKPELSGLPHNFAYYAMAIMATYPPQGASLNAVSPVGSGLPIAAGLPSVAPVSTALVPPSPGK